MQLYHVLIFVALVGSSFCAADGPPDLSKISEQFNKQLGDALDGIDTDKIRAQTCEALRQANKAIEDSGLGISTALPEHCNASNPSSIISIISVISCLTVALLFWGQGRLTTYVLLPISSHFCEPMMSTEINNVFGFDLRIDINKTEIRFGL